MSEASVLVPLSEGELRRKILAIFKHQSQKDKAPFPGPDEREFWQTDGGPKPWHGGPPGEASAFRPTSPWRPTWWSGTG